MKGPNKLFKNWNWIVTHGNTNNLKKNKPDFFLNNALNKLLSAYVSEKKAQKIKEKWLKSVCLQNLCHINFSLNYNTLWVD